MNKDYGMQRLVALGGVWCLDRVAKTKGLPIPCCPKCGASAKATFEHQVWECPWTKALDDPRIQATDGLCSEAKAGFERQAGFWMRGLVPWDWTFGRVAEHALNSKTRIFGPWSNGVWVLPDQAIAATDGSGGEHSADPRLRRVGWGAVVSTAYAVWPIAWASGGVQGTQTVPRAELQALVWLAQNTSGTVDVAIDAAYVVKGVAKGPRFVHDNHMDLWSALWSAMRNRVGKINAFWTKAHCSLDQLEQGLAITWAFVLNHVADQLADEAAEKAQLPAAVVDIVRWIDARASKVQSRLLAASMLWLPDNPDTEVAPVPDSPLQVSKTAVVQDLIGLSDHCVVKKAVVLWCSKCNTSIASSRPVETIRKWLAITCNKKDYAHHPELGKFVMHCSHVPSTYRGVHFCASCGGWKVHKSVKLGKECPGKPTAAGKVF
ncbi:unnamed protein product [Polarella glacialis]|uniref:RNase H type-1 domain-containing protein n=1 Tax=Polarella glacialis TaxID=89957 RepID=A0A813EYR9_POLGL|nr:unnamed protein product [Polarella glacialis]